MGRTKQTARNQRVPNFNAKPDESQFIETVVKEEGVPDNTAFKDHIDERSTKKRKTREKNTPANDTEIEDPRARIRDLIKDPRFQFPILEKSITDEMWNRIRPIRETPTGRQYLKVPEDINMSYHWAGEVDGPVTEPLVMLLDMYMICTYQYHGFFKPLHIEVLSQIPESLRSAVKAYDIVWFPQDSDDLNLQKDYFQTGMHRFFVRLFGAPSAEK